MSDIRLVTLGPPACGKTSIIKRFLFNTFSDKYKPTMEDLFSKEFLLNGVNIKVDILDTAGRVEFPAMRRLSISNASAFLFVYSVEKSPDCVEGEFNPSLKAIQDCFEEVKEIRGSLQGIPIIFAGNKSDLISSNELMVGGHGSTGSGIEGSASDIHHNSPNHPLAQLEGIEDLHISFTTCSAKTNYNVQHVFHSFLLLYKQISEVNTSSFKRRSSSKSSKNTLQTEEPKSRRSRSLIRRSSRKVKQQVEFIEPECRMA